MKRLWCAIYRPMPEKVGDRHPRTISAPPKKRKTPMLRTFSISIPHPSPGAIAAVQALAWWKTQHSSMFFDML